MAAIIHWKLCYKEFGFEYSNKYYKHVVTKEKKVLQKDKRKILWITIKHFRSQ